MPSGAKRRKAAKKKKEKEASSSATHSHGDDEQHLHDDKESDGGGVNSPTSQEHREDEEVEKREVIPSMVSKIEPVEGADVNGESAVPTNESNVIEIDWEFKPEEDDPGSKNVESVKESHKDKSSSSSSSSSSSDDESFTFEKKEVVIESGEPEKDVLNSAVESGAISELVKTDDSSEVTPATDAVNDYAHSVSFTDLADLPEITEVIDSAPVVKADSSVEASSTEEAYNEVAQTLPLVTPENVNISNEVEPVLDSHVPDLGSKENGETNISELPQVVTEVGSELTKKEMSSKELENSVVASNEESFLSHEEEDKLLPASSVPVIDVGNGTEQSKDYAVSECSDKQPLVASAPRPVQTTSWSGCCGLFELFTGSDR